jgi:cbb3-type cytochrome oxidase subunit 3
MSVAAVLMPVADLVVRAADQAPKDEDVKAGGWGALVFVLLILAVVVLAFSLAKQLRKAQAAKDAGVFGSDDEPADSASDSDADSEAEPENHSAS